MTLPDPADDIRWCYRRRNPHCELSPWLVRFCPALITTNHLRTPTHTHHIFHRGGRHDLWSNLVNVSAALHPTWMHETCPIDARVLCLFVKWQKGELDLDELNRAAGAVRPDAQPVLAWLSTAAPQYAWAQRLARELASNL